MVLSSTALPLLVSAKQPESLFPLAIPLAFQTTLAVLYSLLLQVAVLNGQLLQPVREWLHGLLMLRPSTVVIAGELPQMVEQAKDVVQT